MKRFPELSFLRQRQHIFLVLRATVRINLNIFWTMLLLFLNNILGYFTSLQIIIIAMLAT